MGDGYVPDGWIGVEILCRRDRRFFDARRLLEVGDVEGAVALLREAGLSWDGILFFVATVLSWSLHEVEEVVHIESGGWG